MAAPAADVKSEVNNGPQEKPQDTPQVQNQFHGPAGRGGRGGMAGPRRFGGPGRRDDNRPGNPNRRPEVRKLLITSRSRLAKIDHGLRG